MKFNRTGILFKYHGDEISLYWPWSRNSKGSVYHSSLLSRDFNSFNQYWKLIGEESWLIKVGAPKGKLLGFSMVDVIAKWSSSIWVNEYLVAMIYPDPKCKGDSFWSRLNGVQISNLLKDVVILRCDQMSTAVKVLESIPKEFSEAYIIFNGDVCRDNIGVEEYKK